MKIFYAILILFDFVSALVLHDKNRIAYLSYLWSNHFGNESSDTRKKTIMIESNYKETQSEVTNNEYSLLLER